MRNRVIQELELLAQADPNLVLITADLGYGVLNHFADAYPGRFFNVGISEQSMAAVAAGMALEGNTVFTYSIGNFPTLRCIEFIRNDICYHNADVKILAVGGGFAYGQLGMSHHATEDIAMMRALPNMRVYVPADPDEAAACLQAAYRTPGPCYLRLARGGEKNQHASLRNWDVKNAICLFEGTEVQLLAAGSVLSEAVTAAELLQARGVSAGVYSFPSVKPIDAATIAYLAEKSRLIVTLEEHTVVGGFGGAVAEVLAELPPHRASLRRFGLQDVFPSVVGDQHYLRGQYGLSATHIAGKITALLGGSNL